jgi:hypothetical protein
MLNRPILLFAAFCCIGMYSSSIASAKTGPPGFVQERFVIGYWVSPPADAQLDDRFREIADAHFTLVLGGEGGNAEKELMMLRKYDLRALDWAAADATMNDPHVWGKAIRDEPSASQFAELKTQVDAFRSTHPNKLAYINLFPDYASAQQMGVPTYEEYVRRFMQVVKPQVLSMDYYPRFIPGSDGRDGYCQNLATMRKYSLQAGIGFWNFFNVMPFGPHTDPTEGQLRWQIYSSIAYGARGVLYFCYYTPAGAEFPRGGAIIDRNGRKTRHYKQAMEINAQLKNLGPTLMQLTSTGVHRVKGADSGDTLNGTLLKKIDNAYSPDVPLDLQIGAFKHQDGRQAVLIHNYRFAYTAWMTVSFSKPMGQIAEIDRATGREIPVYDESPAMPGTQISLDAGDGRLFIAAKPAPATRKQ